MMTVTVLAVVMALAVAVAGVLLLVITTFVAFTARGAGRALLRGKPARG